MSELAGYRGRALEFLNRAKASIGDVLEAKTEWGTVTGTLVPRYEHADDGYVVLKLRSGYNIGLAVSKLKGASVKMKGEKPAFAPPGRPEPRTGLPRVLILGTGGTIASRVDYRTGAVRPAISAGELQALIPELSDIAEIEPEITFNVFSENIGPARWSKLAARVKRAVAEGYGGVVVTHGTDTLGYTAAALSFALQGVPVPVILVGAQRSSDRPSSDATQNLIGGVSVAANAAFSGVYVAMHLDESDDAIALHRGTRVRKNHTSRRDAFLSVGVSLAAVWRPSGIEQVAPDLPKRGDGARFRPASRFDGKVALLKFYPSMPSDLISAVRRMGARGLILEGTGLGHVNSKNITAVKAFVKGGGLVCMTSQCVNGRVDLNVYDTGRDLVRAGVVPLEDMLAETALVKAMWALGNSATVMDARAKMLENLAGEMTPRRFPG
ncbi:MAG: Glu-tRNA(Gln) amidotransferase subunit GatD [Nitrososphaerales archaeon]|jgi:glutamyl-tRNA(Gln) amidotransferase subunit D